MSVMASGATIATIHRWGTYSSLTSEGLDLPQELKPKEEPKSRLKEWLEAHRKT